MAVTALPKQIKRFRQKAGEAPGDDPRPYSVNQFLIETGDSEYMVVHTGRAETLQLIHNRYHPKWAAVLHADVDDYEGYCRLPSKPELICTATVLRETQAAPRTDLGNGAQRVCSLGQREPIGKAGVQLFDTFQWHGTTTVSILILTLDKATYAFTADLLWQTRLGIKPEDGDVATDVEALTREVLDANTGDFRGPGAIATLEWLDTLKPSLVLPMHGLAIPGAWLTDLVKLLSAAGSNEVPSELRPHRRE